jgi:hypothetical protein
MDIRHRFIFFVLSCVDLGMGLSPVQGVLPTVYKIYMFSKVNSESEQARGPNTQRLKKERKNKQTNNKRTTEIIQYEVNF